MGPLEEDYYSGTLAQRYLVDTAYFLLLSKKLNISVLLQYKPLLSRPTLLLTKLIKEQKILSAASCV